MFSPPQPPLTTSTRVPPTVPGVPLAPKLLLNTWVCARGPRQSSEPFPVIPTHPRLSALFYLLLFLFLPAPPSQVQPFLYSSSLLLLLLSLCPRTATGSQGCLGTRDCLAHLGEFKLMEARRLIKNRFPKPAQAWGGAPRLRSEQLLPNSATTIRGGLLPSVQCICLFISWRRGKCRKRAVIFWKRV